MLHWLNTELWGPMWPNIFAPSAITLTAIITSHMLHRRNIATHVDRLRGHISGEISAVHRHLEGGPRDERLL